MKTIPTGCPGIILYIARKQTLQEELSGPNADQGLTLEHASIKLLTLDP